MDVDWQRMERALDAAFHIPKLTLPEGRVLRATEPTKFLELVSSAVEGEEEVEELESEGLASAVAERWQMEDLLEFEWESGGPMSSFADLVVLRVGRPRIFVGTYQEALQEAGEDPWLVLAAIEPADSSVVMSEFVRDLIGDDGRGYGLEVFFGGLPSNTRNFRPDLIPAEVVKASYWSWMEWASKDGLDVWTDLRDDALRKAMDPRVLRPFVETFLEAWGNVDRKPLRDREGAALSESDRQRILDNYFSQTYREG
jgi:hypothetical protein